MADNLPQVKEIKKVKFGILSPEKIKQISVVEVYKQLTNDIADTTQSSDVVNMFFTNIRAIVVFPLPGGP